MSRESRSPEYIKNDLNTNNDVFHSFDLRQDQLNYEDQDDDDGDVTPRVCQLDSVRELDEDKEIREITEKYFTFFIDKNSLIFSVPINQHVGLPSPGPVYMTDKLTALSPGQTM